MCPVPVYKLLYLLLFPLVFVMVSCAPKGPAAITAGNDAFASWGAPPGGLGGEVVDSKAEAAAAREAYQAWLNGPADWRSFDAERLEGEIWRVANLAREREGLSSLPANPALASVARAHSVEMALTATLSHQSPMNPSVGLVERVSIAGLSFKALAENVAMEPLVRLQWESGRQDLYTWGEVAARVVASWEASPSHRENLLRKDLRQVGVGAALSLEGEVPAVYITQDLMR